MVHQGPPWSSQQAPPHPPPRHQRDRRLASSIKRQGIHELPRFNHQKIDLVKNGYKLVLVDLVKIDLVKNGYNLVIIIEIDLVPPN